MTGSTRMGRVVVAFVLYAGALTTVAWRQSTTRETMEEIDRLARELAIATEEREELGLEVLGLEQRRWVVVEAARRLGLRPPREDEVVLTPGGSR